MLACALCLLPALAGALSVQGEKKQAPESAVKRFAELSSGEWDPSSLSGPGSRPEVSQPFADFFLKWLDEKGVQSMVEVSAGHWPSGWQRFVEWPDIDYVGVDLLDDVIKDDNAYVSRIGAKNFGFRSMLFQKGDMLNDTTLPKADLLFTKDTLIHFPNKYIKAFIDSTVLQCPPKYKYVMFVHDSKLRHQSNGDIAKFGEYHGFNLSNPPFSYPVNNIFSWEPDYDKKKRAVQLIEPARYCP